MKFLLISPFTSISGSAIRFWNIARRLQNLGYKVVYVERVPKDTSPPLFPEIEYHCSPKLNNLFIDIFYSLLFNLFILFKNLDCSVYYALKPAPNNCFPALLAKLLGKKIVLDIDDIDYGYFNKGFKRKISRFFFDSFPKHFHYITYHTEAIKKYITQNLLIPEQKTYYLPQGVSTFFLNYKTKESIVTESKSLVYVATLGITSDFEDLLPMFKTICQTHSDVFIKIIGDGVKRSVFEKKINLLGISQNFNFLGRIDHNKLPETIATCQVGLNYMHPSFTNNCRAILKIREYLALGLKIVCNNVGDAYLFKDYIYIENNIENMGKRIIELLNSKIDKDYEGRYFLKENFHWDKIVYDFINFIPLT